jgi:hypothetical protein
MSAIHWGRLGAPVGVTLDVMAAGMHCRGIVAADVGINSSLAVTAGRRDGTVVVWDIALKRPRAFRCFGPGSDPVDVAMSQGGTRVLVCVAGAAAGAEELSVSASGHLVSQGPLLNGLAAYCARYGTGGAGGMAVIGSKRVSVVYAVGAARRGLSAALAVLIGHSGAVVAADFVRGGGGVVTAGDDGSMFVYSTAAFGEADTTGTPVTGRMIDAAAAAAGLSGGGRGDSSVTAVRPQAVMRTDEAPLLRGASHAASLVWVPSEEPVTVRLDRVSQRSEQLKIAKRRGRRGSVVMGASKEATDDAQVAERLRARRGTAGLGWWETGGFLMSIRALDAVSARIQVRGSQGRAGAGDDLLPWEGREDEGAPTGRSATHAAATAERAQPAQTALPPRHAPRELLMWQAADISASGLDPGVKSVVMATPLTAAFATRLPPLKRIHTAVSLLSQQDRDSTADAERALLGGVVIWGATEDGSVGPVAVSRAVHANALDTRTLEMPGVAAQSASSSTSSSGSGDNTGAHHDTADRVDAPRHSRVLAPHRALISGSRWVRPHAGPVRRVRAAADGCVVVSAGAVDGVLAVMVVEGAAIAAIGSVLQLPPLPPSAVRGATKVARGLDTLKRVEATPVAADKSGSEAAGPAAAANPADAAAQKRALLLASAAAEVPDAMSNSTASTLWQGRVAGLTALLSGGIGSLSTGNTASVIASVMGQEEGSSGAKDDEAGDEDAENDEAAAASAAGPLGGLAGSVAEAAVHFGEPASAIVSVSAGAWEQERHARVRLRSQLSDQQRAHRYALADAVRAERHRLESRVAELEQRLSREMRGREADKADFHSRDERTKAEARAAELRRVRSLMDLERRRVKAEELAAAAVSAAEAEAQRERERAAKEVAAQMAARKASETHIASRFEDAVVAARKERSEAMERVEAVRHMLEEELGKQAEEADGMLAEARARASRAEAEARKAAVESRVALKAKDATLAGLESTVSKAEKAFDAQRARAEEAEEHASLSAEQVLLARTAERNAMIAADGLMQEVLEQKAATVGIDQSRGMALDELGAQRDRVQPRERLIEGLRRELAGMEKEAIRATDLQRGTQSTLEHVNAALRSQQAETKRVRNQAAKADSTLRRSAALVERLAKRALAESDATRTAKAWQEVGTRLYRLLVLGDDRAVAAGEVFDADSDDDPEASKAAQRAAGHSLFAAGKRPDSRSTIGGHGRSSSGLPLISARSQAGSGRGPQLKKPGTPGSAGPGASLRQGLTRQSSSASLSANKGSARGLGASSSTASMRRHGAGGRGSRSAASLPGTAFAGPAPHAKKRAIGSGKRFASTEGLLAPPEPLSLDAGPSLRTQDFERQRRALATNNETLRRNCGRTERQLLTVERRMRSENTAMITQLNEERHRTAEMRAQLDRARAADGFAARRSQSFALTAGGGTAGGHQSAAAESMGGTAPASSQASKQEDSRASKPRRGSGGEGSAVRALRRLASGRSDLPAGEDGDDGLEVTWTSTGTAARSASRSRAPSRGQSPAADKVTPVRYGTPSDHHPGASASRAGLAPPEAPLAIAAEKVALLASQSPMSIKPQRA